MSTTNDNDFLTECDAKANEAKGIAAKATEGPWISVIASSYYGSSGVNTSSGVGVFGMYGSNTRDAEFIAHARTSNPDLAERVLQLVAMVRKLQEQVDDMQDRAREEAYYRDLERD